MVKRIGVIGGGAAGFFAAANIASACRECRVTILEKSTQLLAKVRISGGGRCNVTHACFDNNLLVSQYPRGEKELKSAFSKFSPTNTIKWFESYGVKLKIETDGRMFPITDTSETIIDCLLKATEENGVKICTSINVKKIEIINDVFLVSDNEKALFQFDVLLLATGGNTNGYLINWLNNIGHTLIPPVPSLFTFNIPDPSLRKLMGLSLKNARVSIDGTKLREEGPVLITHWGLSGPAILKLSAWGARILFDLNYKFRLKINWLNLDNKQIYDELILIRNSNSKMQIGTKGQFEIPLRMWLYFLEKAAIKPEFKWADVTNKLLSALSILLSDDVYHVNGKTTFKEEFVTCGGVKLNEVDFKTMESKKLKGVYFAGELLDIDGITGGYNFQNAWTTGWIAAQAISNS